MCGRYTHLYTWKQLHRLLGLTSCEVELRPSYNVAPTQSAPVIVNGDSAGGASLRFMRWGLVPSWAKDIAIGNSLINARAEGIDTKPAFRAAFKKSRCIVPISGFYEWQKVEGQKAKQPFYIQPTDGEPWLLAGLWESWRPAEGPPLESFVIITTRANAMVARIHDRMPVILGAPDARRWMAPTGAGGADLLSLLSPYPDEGMKAYPVSVAVNRPGIDSPALVQPLERRDFGGIFDSSP